MRAETCVAFNIYVSKGATRVSKAVEGNNLHVRDSNTRAKGSRHAHRKGRHVYTRAVTCILSVATYTTEATTC